MKNTGITRKLDELGRVTLPIELRKNLGIAHGSELDIYVEDNKIIIEAKRELSVETTNIIMDLLVDRIPEEEYRILGEKLL